MKSKFSAQQRLELIQKALKGESISKICQEAGVSRTLLYKFINKYKKENQENQQQPKKNASEIILELVKLNPDVNISQILNLLPRGENGKPIVSLLQAKLTLRKLHLNTASSRKRFSVKPENWKFVKKPLQELLEPRARQIRPQDRLDIIKRVEGGESVSRICQIYGISRTIVYRWQKRYDQAVEGQKLEALWDQKPKVSKYFNQAPEQYEQAVLSAVKEYPELSSHRLVWVLPQVGGRPILGNHGVQNVLRRHNLSTYELRLSFAQQFTKPTLTSRFYGAFQFLLKLITSTEPGKRKYTVRGGMVFLLTLFAATSVYGLVAFVKLLIQAPSLAFSIGILFSMVALVFGMFFFLYSLKYYITIAMILSFSRQMTGGRQSLKSNTFFSNLIGRAKDEGNSSDYSRGLGLQADLSAVSLDRKPFVSIHLATYNEKRVLERLLTAATSQQYENYEVVLVDDSTDETLEILEKWKNHPRVKIIHRQSRAGFKGGALKEALKVMDPRTEFIIIFDADFIPYPDTITQFLKYYKSTTGSLDRNKVIANNIAAVQGYQWHVLNKSENWVTRGVRTEYAGSYVIERAGIELYSGLKQIAGSVYMIRADVIKSLGWGTSITEDFELTLRLYNAGYKVVYTPYVQAPAEAVSTIKRIIRQRMRWAEGHSFNIKRMFKNLILSDKLNRAEKFEVLYLTPYYLQSLFFIIGTLCWFLAEVAFHANLPFWTSTWGWSLVFTNLLALPLMNLVGLFLEESDQKDYLGLASFVALSYILAPFQAYAALKGFIEKEEGPWFRTPKTGKITDVFTPGKFYNLVFGWFGKGANVTNQIVTNSIHHQAFDSNQYLALATSNNRFDSFKIGKKRLAWIANFVLILLLTLTTLLVTFAPFIPISKEAQATSPVLLNPDDIKKAPILQSVSQSAAEIGKQKTLNQTEKESFIERAKTDRQPKNQASPKKDSDYQDITTPRIIRKTSPRGSSNEFIFHQDPRVRIRTDRKTGKGVEEMEIKTLKIGGLSINPKRSRIYKDEEVIYFDVLPGLDIKYTITSDLVVEDFIVKDKKALGYFKKQAEIEQSLNTINSKVVSPGNPTSYGFFSADGREQIFDFGQPYAEDAKKAKTKDIEITVEKQTVGYKMIKHIKDQAKVWMFDSTRELPIRIDPTVIISGSVTAAETNYGSMQRKIAVTNTTANSVGFQAPGTAADDAMVGSNVWSNPSNATSSNNQYATVTLAVVKSSSDYLKTTNYTFTSVASNAIIEGIQVRVERKASADLAIENSVKIVKAGLPTGVDHSTGATVPTTEAAITYGSAFDLWGVGWTRADITNSGFGAAFSAKDNSVAKTTTVISVDLIDITVYYSDPAGTLAWYAFDADGGTINYRKSTNGGSSWGASVPVNNADTDNENVSIGVSGKAIIIAWIDTSAAVQVNRLDTTSGGDALDSAASGSQCTPAAVAVATTYTVTVAATSGNTAVTALSDTSTGTEISIRYFTSVSACTSSGVATGNITFGSGLSASDVPVVVAVDGSQAVVMIRQDGSLLYSLLNANEGDWIRNNLTIASVTDSTYSVTTDGTTVWILSISGTTTTNFYSCCTANITTSTVDSDTGSASQDNVSDVKMYCVSTTNCKFVYTDDLDTTAPILKFVDCSDAGCTSPTSTSVDTDIGASGDQAGASVYCLSDTDCKVAYGDTMDTATPLLKFVDCSDAACSTQDTGSPVTLDSDLGSSTAILHTAIDCLADGTDCKVLYNDSGLSDLIFIDCASTACGTQNTGSPATLDTTFGGVETTLALDCTPGTSDCKVVYHDANSSDIVFIDCANTACSSQGTSSPQNLDTTAGSTGGLDPIALRCPSATDCKVAYGDSGSTDMDFIDCGNSNCTTAAATITVFDSTGGSNNSTNFPSISMYCVSATDCKITYVPNFNNPKLYFVDCDAAACTTGSVMDMPGGRYRGAIYCSSSTDCKFAYYDLDSSQIPTLVFALDTSTNGFPTSSTLTAPYTSETNLTGVSLTYDIVNSRIYAHAIKDTNQQAYFRDTDKTTISWGTKWPYYWALDAKSGLSSPIDAQGTSMIAVVLQRAASTGNFEFATLPERTYLLFLLIPFFPLLLKRLKSKEGETE